MYQRKNEMAKLIIDSVEYEIADGELIRTRCEEAGVFFNCNTGICGLCSVKVVEGNENLSDLTPEEEDLGMDGTSRLACVCSIKSGTVILEI